MSANIPLLVPDEDLAEITALAKDTGLSKEDVIRQSSRLGRPLLREQLAPNTGRVTNVDPLPDAVLERLYRERDDNSEGIDALMAAQPIHRAE